VTSCYCFRTLRIPLLAGREFTEADGEKSAKVALVSESTARKFWPGENPLGKYIRDVWGQERRIVVGVVGDVRQFDLAGKTPSYINGAFYMPYPQSIGLDRKLPTAMTLILRTAANAPQLAGDLRSLVASVNPNAPISEILAYVSVSGMAFSQNCKASLPGRRDEHLLQQRLQVERPVRRNQLDTTSSTFPYQPSATNQHFIPLFYSAGGFLLTHDSLLRNMLLCQLSILKNSTES